MKFLASQLILDRNNLLKNERKEFFSWRKEITMKFDPQMDQTLTLAERPNIRTDLALMFAQKIFIKRMRYQISSDLLKLLKKESQHKKTYCTGVPLTRVLATVFQSDKLHRSTLVNVNIARIVNAVQVTIFVN